MVTPEEIHETVQDIVREIDPIRIILFGSYAYGQPTEDSDVDLLVIASGELNELRELNRRLYRNTPRRFRRDMIVRSPKEISFRLTHHDCFLEEVLSKGRVLYESANDGMDRKG